MSLLTFLVANRHCVLTHQRELQRLNVTHLCFQERLLLDTGVQWVPPIMSIEMTVRNLRNSITLFPLEQQFQHIPALSAHLACSALQKNCLNKSTAVKDKGYVQHPFCTRLMINTRKWDVGVPRGSQSHLREHSLLGGCKGNKAQSFRAGLRKWLPFALHASSKCT